LGVAFARSSLRRIASYASVVAPRRLASDAFLVIRDVVKPTASTDEIQIRRWIRVSYDQMDKRLSRNSLIDAYERPWTRAFVGLVTSSPISRFTVLPFADSRSLFPLQSPYTNPGIAPTTLQIPLLCTGTNPLLREIPRAGSH
jgi:hypothetical protein